MIFTRNSLNDNSFVECTNKTVKGKTFKELSEIYMKNLFSEPESLESKQVSAREAAKKIFWKRKHKSGLNRLLHFINNPEETISEKDADLMVELFMKGNISCGIINFPHMMFKERCIIQTISG